MSATTIYQAAYDTDLNQRVSALAHKEVRANAALADTQLGRALLQGTGSAAVLMFGVAVQTEAAYETALLSGRGAPGHDEDVITDAALTSAIVASWPSDPV